MTGEPTRRQQEVLDFVREHLADHGRPPTMREAAAHFGWSSNGAIRCHLTALERKGLIEWDRGDARGLRLVGEMSTERVVHIPLVGSVPAGLPAEHIPESNEMIAVAASVFRATRDLFALRVRGDSMIGAGIMDGDRLIVRRVMEAAPGQIVVVNIDGETTVKRYILHRRRPALHPENPAYRDIVPTAGQEWRIEGIAVGSIRVF